MCEFKKKKIIIWFYGFALAFSISTFIFTKCHVNNKKKQCESRKSHNKKGLITYKKGLLSHMCKKRFAYNYQKPMANSHGKFLRQILE